VDESEQAQSGWRSGVLTAALALAVLHLILCNIAPGAPLYQWQAEHSPQLDEEQRFVEIDDACQGVAHGENLAMHFEGFNFDNADDGRIASELYFRAAYTLYPRQVFVGSGGQIINGQDQLKILDVLRDDPWMRQHGIGGVLTVRRDTGKTGYELDPRAVSGN
jgi:hypothetical protein